MALSSRPHTRSLLTLAVAGVVATGLSGAGLADPWMALVSDTGLFDTGSAATDDTGAVADPVDTAEPGDADGDDTGEPGGSDGDDTGEPGDSDGDDTGEPGDSDGDDTGETGDSDGDDTGETGDSDADDTGEPGGDDTGAPSDDTGEPEDDTEPLDTGGKSAAELAGEKGGCGCAASSPPSGMLAVLIALGLVTRRRSVPKLPV